MLYLYELDVALVLKMFHMYHNLGQNATNGRVLLRKWIITQFCYLIPCRGHSTSMLSLRQDKGIIILITVPVLSFTKNK